MNDNVSRNLKFPDGYYWARHSEGTTFIVKLEDGEWFTIGIQDPIDFDPRFIIGEVQRVWVG